MDGEKPASMDRAKEAIKTFYKGNESKYLPIWQIIDSRWDRQLHSPMHAAGAYLNPSLFYNEGSSIQRDPKVMRAHWWIDCGTEAPQLQEFAIRVLSQPCSASSWECNSSVFEHIHNKNRNKLEHERLEKLVFIYYNLRMLTKQAKPKDTDPILLDTIDLESNWVVEEAAPDLSRLDEEIEHLSSLPFQMETPNTPAS
eukprot:PITA_01478